MWNTLLENADCEKALYIRKKSELVRYSQEKKIWTWICNQILENDNQFLKQIVLMEEF